MGSNLGTCVGGAFQALVQADAGLAPVQATPGPSRRLGAVTLKALLSLRCTTLLLISLLVPLRTCNAWGVGVGFPLKPQVNYFSNFMLHALCICCYRWQ